jgi:hypothetical protein
MADAPWTTWEYKAVAAEDETGPRAAGLSNAALVADLLADFDIDDGRAGFFHRYGDGAGICVEQRSVSRGAFEDTRGRWVVRFPGQVGTADTLVFGGYFHCSVRNVRWHIPCVNYTQYQHVHYFWDVRRINDCHAPAAALC